ncbi:hypothetical protein [Erythrobacter litoralis]|uniref:Uncharacterized protein n=1 Tax=Erythrobacter litoralis (strain HTCC2594) TaxID=314225 RepID=Q2N9A2_ERYLH|nr:hypothetical protein [Erythrobacter litoralis]ABC63739.1 hypothetical protein ELI_08235 [Erythrobacter litoralis HTCC2594]
MLDPPSLPTRKIARQATSAVAHIAPPPAPDDPLLAFEPVPHVAPRSNSITPDLQRAFIATLAATGIVTQAAKSIGKSMEALYKLRQRPGAEGFRAAWEAALERGVQRLEDCALERALQGTPTPIVSGGEILGYWDKPDNVMLRFLLQHRLSGKYGVQQLGPGHPVYDSIRAEVLEEIAAAEREAAALEKRIERRVEAARAETREATLRECEAAATGDDGDETEAERTRWRETYRGHYPDLDDEIIEEMVERMVSD